MQTRIFPVLFAFLFLSFSAMPQESFSIGKSVLKNDITAFRFGYGSRYLVIMGGIHGDETKTTVIAYTLVDRLMSDPGMIPETLSVFIVPRINADAFSKKSPGYIYGERFNAHCVDLNRNFRTLNWKPNIVYGDKVTYYGLGGKKPGSEPETQAVVAFINRCRQEAGEGNLLVLNLHQYVTQYEKLGCVLPVKKQSGDIAGYYAHRYGDLTGYPVTYTFGLYEVSGDLILWAEEQGIPAFDVEISRLKRENSIALNVKSILAIMDEYGTRELVAQK